MTRFLAAAFSMLIASTAFAQATTPYTPMQPIPVGDILLTLPSSHIADARTWEIRFSHRFNQSLDSGNVLHSLFGLDGGANVGIGLSYVPIRDLQLAIERQSTLETFEGSAKYVITQQAHVLPFSAAVRWGVDWRNAQGLDDRSSYFAQAIVSHQFGSRFDVYVVPTWITNAGRTANGTRSVALFDHAFNVPVGALVQLRPGISIVGEIIPPNHDLPDTVKADLGWSAGLKTAIGGHLFEVMLTNNTGMTTDQYITSTFNGAPFRSNDLRLGFNIERRWGKGVKRWSTLRERTRPV
jgi:hypothetical protein